MKLRLLFAGNPPIALQTLEALTKSFDVVGVLTNKDKPTGRGRKIEMPAVKKLALDLGIPVLQYDKLGKEAREEVSRLQPNFLLSFACGHYFGPKFLQLFPLGSANVHPSLLPLYRGCAPLQFALLKGERESGITIQRIAKEIDSGNILAQIKFPLEGFETTESLSDFVAQKAPTFVVDTLKQIEKGELKEIEQRGEPSWTTFLSKEDGLIDWSESVHSIHCKVRALYPWPKAYTHFEEKVLFISGVWGSLDQIETLPLKENHEVGKVLHLDKERGLAISCGDGVLYVTKVQLAQKKEMASRDFVNGNPQIIGSYLG